MKSNFSVTCPRCERVNDFGSENWDDRWLDDSMIHDKNCLNCGFEMQIKVNATYVLEIDEEQIAGVEGESEKHGV